MIDESVVRSHVKNLREVIHLCEHLLSDRDVAHAYEYLDVGEYKVAYELVCVQLYEYDAVVSKRVAGMLSDLGLWFGVDSGDWEMLRVESS